MFYLTKVVEYKMCVCVICTVDSDSCETLSDNVGSLPSTVVPMATFTPDPSPASVSEDSQPRVEVPEPCNDIGNLLNSTNPSRKSAAPWITCQMLENIPCYFSMLHHLILSHEHFPHGCYHKFNTSWLEKYSWLRYSPSLDAVFCGACALLLHKDKQKDKGVLVKLIGLFQTG